MKRVKQVLTRFSTMFLALICVIGMGTPVFAVDGDTPTEISVDLTANFNTSVPVAGFDVSDSNKPTLDVYQIISVDVDSTTNTPKNPMYYWDNSGAESGTSVAEWVASFENNKYSNYISEDNSVTDKFKDMLAEQQSEFLEELAAAIKDGSISINPVQSIQNIEADLKPVSNLGVGEYLLIANGGVKLYKPTTIQLLPEYKPAEQGGGSGKWVVNVPQDTFMKGAAPQIEKSVASENETVSTGETVTYTLEVDVPSYPVNATARAFEIGDTMDVGITYQSDVKVYSDSQCTKEIPVENNTFYTVTNKPGNANGFKISFNTDFFDDATYGKLTKIYVKYTGKVNTYAFSAETDALGNDAYVKYNNNPYDPNSYNEDRDDEDVYAYRIEINKVDKEGEPLTGAKFTLTKKGENTALKFTKATIDTDGTYYVYDPNGEDASDVLEVSSLSGDPAIGGTFLIKGLDQGEYVLTETKAPDGYVLPTGSIAIKLDGIDTDLSNLDNDATTAKPNGTHKLHVVEDTSTGVTVTDATISVDVENTKSEDADFTLPSTGGMGTLIFTVGGLFVMAGAVVLAVVMYKKKNA